MNQKIGILIFIAVFEALQLFGQVEYPLLSPKGIITQKVGNAEFKIEYERPLARKRTIFGDLVPWGKIWRTGAGNCTKISFDKPVIVGGQKLPAGKYSLFTIPNVDKWIVIFNSDTTLYGTFKYDRKKDVARFMAIPRHSDRYYETLTIDIDLIFNNANLYISWENTQISCQIETTIDNDIINYINKELLTKKEKDSDKYASAVEYLLFQNEKFIEAIKLADIAIELNISNGWARRLKMEIYEKLLLYEEALEASEQALQYEKIKEERPYWIEQSKRIKAKMK